MSATDSNNEDQMLMAKIERIKNALRMHIEEAKEATEGPWCTSVFGSQILTGDDWSTVCVFIETGQYGDHRMASWENGRTAASPTSNPDFICGARTMSPAACEGLLISINALLRINTFPNFIAAQALADIAAKFPN